MRPITKKNIVVLRALIILGCVSIVNFFYWFLDLRLIENTLTYALLCIVFIFDSFRLLYIWYHYWSIGIPKKKHGSREFSIDVFTTYYPGEPKEMLKKTLLAMKAMQLDHQNYLCDEADDPELKSFCECHGIHHITRHIKKDAKAGNINNALLKSYGDLCLILDPDHIPYENFLVETVSYFEDDDIGFVQTAQTYYNQEESIVAKAAAEQTFMFYGPVMMTMNTYGTVNAIGANCFFRRKALESIGGHAAGLSEDMHTAMRLHAEGWKSIYVPKALSSGLAPATLVSYYQQQLKWSRGTLELLCTSYPALFKKLTNFQKLHYGILPLFYFSGFIYMVSFLIPILSLLTSTTPYRGNIVNFALISLPIIVLILGIRFYAQNWLIDKRERGMHLLGGLLLQCTWWIYILGVIYTIFRKKVLYLPTEKDDKSKTNLSIMLPNLVVVVVSAFAIVFGLVRDFTPFSIVMSGFALWNIFIMLSTISFGLNARSLVNFSNYHIHSKHFSKWRIGNILFHIWYRYALVCLTIILSCFIWLQYTDEQIDFESFFVEEKENTKVKYFGVFSPKTDSGISNMKQVEEFSTIQNRNVNIISHYLAWSPNTIKNFPERLFEDTYAQNALPMITWEPWITAFDVENNDSHVFDLINEGQFDEFIYEFAKRLKALNRPVFLRFAHEFDNPFYPWYDERIDAPERFKKAWTHVHSIFETLNCENVVWVYNPWKPEHVADYFPGDDLVDWFSVNILNYSEQSSDPDYYSFKDLYEPFHNEIVEISELPVMISELGTLSDTRDQANWLGNTFNTITSDFAEIYAIIFFNSSVDNNLPQGFDKDRIIDWTFSSKIEGMDRFYANYPKAQDITTIQAEPLLADKEELVRTRSKKTIGVNYKIGENWKNDFHVLNRAKLKNDFELMKLAQIETIRFLENDVYDYNVISLSEVYGIDISYGFWIPETIDFVEDQQQSQQLKSHILNSIKKLKKHKGIVSWHIQNDIISKQEHLYHQPKLLYQKKAFLKWLKQLVVEIELTDPSRPLILDLEFNANFKKHYNNLKFGFQEIDAIGLLVDDAQNIESRQNFLNDSIRHNYMYASISAHTVVNTISKYTDRSVFIKTWQDKHESNKLGFEGLIDRKGRIKKSFSAFLSHMYGKSSQVEQHPPIEVLKELRELENGNIVKYFAMIYDDDNGWHFPESRAGVFYEWSLIRLDDYGESRTLKELGVGEMIEFQIPDNYNDYLLLLSRVEDGYVSQKITSLNVPYNN